MFIKSYIQFEKKMKKKKKIIFKGNLFLLPFFFYTLYTL